MTSIKQALLVAAAMMLPAGAASALTLTYSGAYGPALTDYAQSLTLTGFDTSLGTLTGVSLAFGVSGTASGTVTNTSASSKFFSVTELVSFGFDYPQAAYLNTLSSGQTYNLGGGATGAFGPNPISNSTTFTVFDFTPYLAPTFDVGLNTLTGVTILGGGGNITTSINTTLGFSAAVTYTYDAAPPSLVPEPASWALLITGFGLVGGALRRRATVAA